MNNDLKMYCVVSKEALALMKGNRGKMMAQAGHAFLHAFLNGRVTWDVRCRAYLETQRAYKVTVVVETTAELLELYNIYKDMCGTALIEDAGLTVFEEPTITCLGIGPIRPNEREEILANLPPLL